MFTVPSLELSAGMTALATFEEESRGPVPVSSHIKEIFLMQSSFKSLSSAIAGFARFAPVKVVQKVLHDKSNVGLGVEGTDATCFFSDIAGFTTISEATDPHVLITALAEYFDAMTDLIVERKGIVGDFIGDAVFAFWNSPLERVARHAYLACDNAIAQQEMLEQLRKSWADRNMPQFRIRIGIHSGAVLAGNVGSSKRLKYTMMGDTVNLAARLEGIGKMYKVEIVVSASTFGSQGVQEAFVGRALDVVTVVGKKEPTKIVNLLCRRASATSDQLEVERLSWLMIDSYCKGNLDDAEAYLNQMLAIIPSDYACKLMVSRVHKLRSEWQGGIPPTEWNGATAMTEK